MRKTEQAGLLAGVLLGVLLLALPVAAAPQDAAAGPTVTEQISGTILGLAPQFAYESATLQVSGPEGYALTKRLEANATIVVDLLVMSNSDPASSVAFSHLPNGRYSYEAVFTNAAAERYVHSSAFFVENGRAVSRGEMRAHLNSVGEDLAKARVAEGDVGRGPATFSTPEWIAVTDGVNDGITYLSLDSDSPSNDFYWLLVNANGDFEITEDTNFTHPGTPRLTVERGGQVGIGTTSPANDSHIVDGGSGSTMRLAGSADSFISTYGTTCTGLCLSAGFVFQLNVTTDGIGAGTLAPEADLHVENIDGGDTVLKLVNAAAWNLGTTSTGVFTFNQSGSGGQEATFRARNDPTATLDVQGHVRGTSFKSTSSRAMKTAFEALDPADVLSRLTELPVTSWRYRTEAEETRHFGPVAEDFQQLFGLGDGRTISTVDADGVLMAALKGLNSKVEQQATELRSKDAEIDALKARLAAIERHLAGTSD